MIGTAGYKSRNIRIKPAKITPGQNLNGTGTEVTEEKRTLADQLRSPDGLRTDRTDGPHG
jgi:hypothetical protein